MRIDFNLDVLWTEPEKVANPTEFAAAMERFAVRLQRFCRVMVGVDERFANLRRGRSRVNFADLPIKKAADFLRNDAYVTSLSDRTSTEGHVGLSIASGISSVMAGSVRLRADHAFWRDEALIRRVAEAMIDFWRAEQACVYTLSSLETGIYVDGPWYFWLDWRRTAETSTLLPDVRVFGEPSVEREWHGGVERLWPEHAPWDHVKLGTGVRTDLP